MADSEWDTETVATVRKYAMQNAVEYAGAGQAGSVLGRLLGERSDLRARARDLKALVEAEVEADGLAKHADEESLPEAREERESETEDEKSLVGEHEPQVVQRIIPARRRSLRS